MRAGTAAVAAVLLLTAGCGSGDPDAATPGPGADAALTGTLTVFAAASLTDVFGELGARLTADNPGLDVRFTFAGSSALATQVLHGAPADVLASADERQVRMVVDEGLAAGQPAVFTSNELWIAVPAGNPAGVTGLDDFARQDLSLALCSPEVPCGSAAASVFEAAGLEPRPDTYEEDVRAALTKVQLGEVDAALVYASDVVAAGGSVTGIALRGVAEAVNRYAICVLADAPHPGAARAFVALVNSDEGQRALADAGFRAP